MSRPPEEGSGVASHVSGDRAPRQPLRDPHVDDVDATSTVLKSIVFTDHTAKRYVFPLEICKFWDEFKYLIEQVYSRIEDGKYSSDVSGEKFDIITNVGTIIMPTVWGNVVRPGLEVWIEFWESSDLSRNRREGRGRVLFSGIRPRSRVLERERDFPEPESIRRRQGSEGEDQDYILEVDEGDEDDSTTDSESEEESEAPPPPPPPPPPRTVIPPLDRDRNKLSFFGDATWPHQHPHLNQGPVTTNDDPLKIRSLQDMKRETLKILQARSVTEENRMSIQIHTLSGPEKSLTSSSVDVRWYHLQGDELDFAQFKNVCLTVDGLSQRLQRLVAKTLEKVEKENVKAFLDGLFIEPGTVLRGDESEQKDSQSVIFSCVPYFDIQVQPKLASAKKDRLFPPRSLMQSYYPYEPLRERDLEQAFNKFGNGSSNSIMYVPVLWVMNIGAHAVVTCGYKPLSSEFVKSITIVREDIKASSLTLNEQPDSTRAKDMASIKLTDWTGRVLIYSLDECKTYFEMEQRLRELRFTSWSSNSASLQLLWHTEGSTKIVTTGNWLDIINRSKNTLIFIELSISDIDEGKEVDTETETTNPENALATMELKTVSTSLIPPFFSWPYLIVQRDEIYEKDPTSATEPKLKEILKSISPVEWLEKVERAVMSETLPDWDATHIVEQSFTSTDYYQSLPEDTWDNLQQSLVTQAQIHKNQGKESSARTRHVFIMNDQCSRLTSSTVTLTSIVSETLKWFVDDLNTSTVLRKVWGAMNNIAKVISQTQHRSTAEPDDLREYTDPEWRSPDTGTRRWTIRSPQDSIQQGKYAPPPEDSALNESINGCKKCRHRRVYDNPSDALKHLEIHLSQMDSSGKTRRANLKDWIRNADQRAIEEVNAGFLAVLDQATKKSRFLLAEARGLAQGVTDSEGKMSKLYSFSPELLKSLQRFVQFFLSMERSIHYTEASYQENVERTRAESTSLPARITRDASNSYKEPYSTEGLEVLHKFCDSVKASLQAARKDLCRMAHTKGPNDYRKRLSLGPEYLCAWFMRRLLVKPVDNSMTTADLYHEYLSTLQFQVNHRPSKRLLRSINLLQEELLALMTVNSWQSKLIEDYTAVLNPTGYSQEIPSRNAMFPHEQLLLSSCLSSLADAKEDYTEMIERCGPLSESTKQSAEINEEDHGKAILIFTIVTVIFVPLSFITSYLGMNTSDIRDMTNKQSLFWEIAIPLTTVTLGSIMLIAYNGDEIKDHIASYGRLLTGKQDTRTTARGISVAQRKQASKVTSQSSSTLDYKSLADEAEFAPPYSYNDIFRTGRNPFADLQVGSTPPNPLRMNQTYEGSLFGPQPVPVASKIAPEIQVRRTRRTGRYAAGPPPPPPQPQPLFGSGMPNYPSYQPPLPAAGPSLLNSGVPTYPKIHKQYLDRETLAYYNIPWEYDATDPDYYVLLQEMGPHETDILFEHTGRIRDMKKRKLYVEESGERVGGNEYAWVRRRHGRERRTRGRDRTAADMFF
ncbi:hypothetical protein BCR34DRAFT_558931 [Clohesyomyces aquaticus]|uniref:Ubiquitin-like domain-containing protein n=1 Tax=Clohesyomyces aquaticus TaxID=1231657 RepID=A0A1Y1ZZP8_9PLEO|nr:hypothetical protein BCR34DRAFT_558931 [Clohesyomyces aquaticus]